jgi:hypothetical protein
MTPPRRESEALYLDRAELVDYKVHTADIRLAANFSD